MHHSEHKIAAAAILGLGLGWGEIVQHVFRMTTIPLCSTILATPRSTPKGQLDTGSESWASEMYKTEQPLNWGRGVCQLEISNSEMIRSFHHIIQRNMHHVLLIRMNYCPCLCMKTIFPHKPSNTSLEITEWEEYNLHLNPIFSDPAPLCLWPLMYQNPEPFVLLAISWCSLWQHLDLASFRLTTSHIRLLNTHPPSRESVSSFRSATRCRDGAVQRPIDTDPTRWFLNINKVVLTRGSTRHMYILIQHMTQRLQMQTT